MNPDFQHFDPPESYLNAAPPAEFWRLLKELSPVLTVGLRQFCVCEELDLTEECGCGQRGREWVLAELVIADVPTFSTIASTNGLPYLTGFVRRTVAVEFGTAKYLDQRDIDAIKAWSPRFLGGVKPFLRKREEYARTQQRGVASDMEAVTREMVDLARPALVAAAEQSGTGLRTVAGEKRFDRALEAEREKDHRRSFRNVVSAETGKADGQAA